MFFLPQKHTAVYSATDPEGSLKDASKGKVVIVAGAGRGIGKAMAHTFAATGVRGLVLISRTKAQLEQTGSEIRTAYPECVVRAFALNISQPDAVREVFEQSASTFGQADVLLANAGTAGIVFACITSVTRCVFSVKHGRSSDQ
ncbi:SDR family NAD(P)-dependent oxidoreductase [Aspergillus glaucus CBS 516.65]|uniref:Ketoreductase (KR) domain-containing protein n=1 Tax=Aspergillus glaucus CBS 516.65 TaxID=1160497 RepID=A0A1L9V9D9_ASPGL|nr:hypothetical protein ASPGLDRAFT_844212 [Aspergillus glaucus CBS 516.65]OJJ80485.1 hypothetical protein ASPGLDRAFT_844212 [Aspergillus glaucus CBS 516.65]